MGRGDRVTALPALIYSWQTDSNHEVAHKLTGALQARELAFEIIDTLTGFPLNPVTVVGSSDSATAGMGGASRIITAANIVPGAGAHSWVVLRWVSGLQICLDWNSNDGWLVSMVISPSAGFTGGTVNARPTATDEVVNMTVQHFTWGNAIGTMHIQAVHSNDGANTYLFVCARGAVQTVLLAGTAYRPPTDWTSPRFAIMRGSSDMTLTATTNYAGNDDRISGYHPTAGVLPMRMHVESIYNEITSAFGHMAVAMAYDDNTWTDEFPMSECGLVSTGVGEVATRGIIPDLWRTGDGVQTGRVFRSAASDHAMACFAGFLIPWPTDTTLHIEAL